MIAMARAGGGKWVLRPDGGRPDGPFQQEFDLLSGALRQRVPCNELEDTPAGALALRWHTDLRVSAAWRLSRCRLRALEAAGDRSPAVSRRRWSIHGGRVELLRPAPSASAKPPRLAPARAGSGRHCPRSPPSPSSPEDELVARRAQEVSFAQHQRYAATAACAGDWARVDTVLQCARDEAKGNEWLTASLASLEQYAATRDREKFAKESAYKSARMMTRLAARDEEPTYAALSEFARPSFLRRLPEEGNSDSREDWLAGVARPPAKGGG